MLTYPSIIWFVNFICQTCLILNFRGSTCMFWNTNMLFIVFNFSGWNLCTYHSLPQQRVSTRWEQSLVSMWIWCLWYRCRDGVFTQNDTIIGKRVGDCILSYQVCIYWYHAQIVNYENLIMHFFTKATYYNIVGYRAQHSYQEMYNDIMRNKVKTKHLDCNFFVSGVVVN